MTTLIQTCFNRDATGDFSKYGIELELDKIIMPFGKWSGKSLEFIETHDPDYMLYLFGQGPGDWRKKFHIPTVKDDRLRAGLDYCYLKWFHKKNQTELWRTYQKQICQYRQQLEELTNVEKDYVAKRQITNVNTTKEKEQDSRATIIPRLLHRRKAIVNTSN